MDCQLDNSKRPHLKREERREKREDHREQREERGPQRAKRRESKEKRERENINTVTKKSRPTSRPTFLM